jgi:mycofactocin precursor
MDDLTTTDVPATAPSPAPSPARTSVTQHLAGDEVLEELLIEEISIDGMCGVY